MLSDDHGAKWRQANVPVAVTLTRVRFLSPTTGWAVGHGGVVLKTTNGGESWTLQLTGDTAARIERDTAKDELAHNVPGAAQRVTVAEQLVANGPDKPFFDIHFTDEWNGLVVGAFGLAFATRDGGKTWVSAATRLDNPEGLHLYELHAAGADLYIAGEQGTVFRASGATGAFSKVTTPYNGTFFGMTSRMSGELILHGLRGNVFRSFDRGESWSRVSVGLPVTVPASTVLNDGRIVLADETGRVLVSTSVGAFRPIDVPNAFSFTGVAQAADGGLVLSGIRGVLHLSANALTESAAK